MIIINGAMEKLLMNTYGWRLSLGKTGKGLFIATLLLFAQLMFQAGEYAHHHTDMDDDDDCALCLVLYCAAAAVTVSPFTLKVFYTATTAISPRFIFPSVISYGAISARAPPY